MRLAMPGVSHRLRSPAEGELIMPQLPCRQSRSTRLAVGIAVAAVSGAVAGRASSPSQPPSDGYVGNAACVPCHREIVERYARSAMGRTSGPADANVIEGSFVHTPSGIAYEIRRGPEGPLLAYSRPGHPEVAGRQRLEYFVGSNTRGRTFLFQIDGFLYQSPINYYARKGVWDMSPGYQQLTTMELNHAVDASCLFCHASRLRRPVAGTSHRFDGAPFLQPGVGCERCHGPGGAHAERRGPIVNPARLAPDRRDDVCRQCHLEGQSRIAKAGRSLLDYGPGDRLADVVSTFVFRGAADGPLGAVSHVEALAASRCKRESGDALWCATCHEPHGDADAVDRAEQYRSRCVTCHAALASDHYSQTRDCTSCHMPRLVSADIAHTAVTDHRIPKRPKSGDLQEAQRSPTKLVEFGAAHTGPREHGLAYAELGARAGEEWQKEAVRLLQRAAEQHPDDPVVLARLGVIDQQRGRIEEAEQAYRLALAEDPASPIAAGNLGVILASRDNLAGAIALWAPAFARNPQLSELGMNLAAAQCAAGRVEDARVTLARLLRHDPDRRHGRVMLAALGARPPRCIGPHAE